MKDKPTTERYRQIISGEREPVGSEKGWLNLEKRVPFNKMPPEKRKEICRKGAEAINALHGEKKTAKQSLERILTIKVSDEILAGADITDDMAARIKRDNPDMTIYDLIQLVAVGRAVSGNIKAAEYVRDTHGDKPVETVNLTADIMTEADRALMASINERLADTGAHIEVVKDIES